MNTNTFLITVADALGVDSSEISVDSTQEELEEWDSLGHLAILQALDEVCGGKLDQVSGLGAMTSLRSIWAALEAAGLANSAD